MLPLDVSPTDPCSARVDGRPLIDRVVGLHFAPTPDHGPTCRPIHGSSPSPISHSHSHFHSGITPRKMSSFQDGGFLIARHADFLFHFTRNKNPCNHSRFRLVENFQFSPRYHERNVSPISPNENLKVFYVRRWQNSANHFLCQKSSGFGPNFPKGDIGPFPHHFTYVFTASGNPCITAPLFIDIAPRKTRASQRCEKLGEGCAVAGHRMSEA